MSTILGTFRYIFQGDSSDLEKTVDGAKKSVGSIGDSFKSMASVAGGVLLAGGITSLPGMVTSFANKASDLAEAQSKVNVVFADGAGDINAWASDSAKSLGLSETAALSAAGTYGNLFASMGLGQQETIGLSKGVIGLATDLGSFNNLGTDEVLEKLRAGLVGEAEPLRALGVNINAAMVEAKAMEMGLTDATGTVTEAGKVQARYALIMEQTSLAQGDFARTSDGAANQQKILGAQMANLTTSLSGMLLPAFTFFITFLNTVVIPGLVFLSQHIDIIAVALGGALLAAIYLMLPALALKAAAWWAVAVAMIAAHAPMVLFIAVAALLAVGIMLLVKNWDTIVQKVPILGVAVDAVKAVFMAFIGFITGSVIPTIMSMLPPIVSTGAAILSAVTTSFNAVMGVISVVMSAVVGFITAHWGTISTVFNTTLSAIQAVVTVVWAAIQIYITTVMGVIQGFITVALGIIKGDWGMVWEGIKGIFESVWSGIQAAARLGLDTLVSWFGELPGLALAAISALPGLLATAGSEALQAMYNGATGFWNGTLLPWVIGIPGMIITGIGNLSKFLYNTGWDVINGLWNGMKAIASDVKNWASNLGGELAGGLKSALKVWSPSRVMMAIGVDTMKGLAIGLENEADKSVLPFMGEVAGGISGAIGAGVSGPESRISGSSRGDTIFAPNITVESGAGVTKPELNDWLGQWWAATKQDEFARTAIEGGI